MKGSRRGLVVAALVPWLPAVAVAQDFEGARLLGLAEAQRALTRGNDSIYINPAGMALGSAYSLEAGYVDDLRGSDRRFNASVIDSQAGPIAGGVAYTYTKRRPEEVAAGESRLEGHRLEIALATRVGETAAIGVTGRYLNLDRKEVGMEADAASFDAFTLDAGLQWRLAESVSLGFAAYNLTNSERRELPISWGGGLGLELGALSVEGDIRYNAQIGEPRFLGGAGYVIADAFPVRAGLAYDRLTEALTLSVGAGFLVDQIAVDVGYRQRLNPEGDSEDRDQRLFGIAVRTVFARM